MGGDRDRPLTAAAGASLVRYTSPDEDSARWWDFPFRAGDIVVSTRSKSGTTWVQMICLLLVYAHSGAARITSARLVALARLAGAAQGGRVRRLAAQAHRRGSSRPTRRSTACPLHGRATYIVVGRHPLDVAVSLYHQGDNIDRRPHGRAHRATREPPAGRNLRCTSGCWRFIDWEGDPRALARHAARGRCCTFRTPGHAGTRTMSCWCTTTISSPTSTAPCAGSPDLLGIVVDEARWPALVQAATFESMRAACRAPDAGPRVC